MDFYPRSPCGERLLPAPKALFTCWIFLSTLSLRRATLLPCFSRSFLSNFYPRSPCGERPLAKVRHCEGYIFLSTLSLRRATTAANEAATTANISIHALLAESDRPPANRLLRQSNFYPRSPCGERLSACCQALQRFAFLSTLSLRRATLFYAIWCRALRYFYPRSPCGERRAGRGHVASRHKISIHALLAESD